MNFKNIIIGSTVAISSLFVGVTGAEARTCFDLPYSHGGGAICNTFEGYNRNGDTVYSLGFTNGSGRSGTGMTVICRGRYAMNWKANGNMSYNYTNTLASYFCSL